MFMTDHKNLTHDTTSHSSQWDLRQRLATDQEYHAKLVYYEGNLNNGADGLSRLHFEKANSKPMVHELCTWIQQSGKEWLFPLDLCIIAQNHKSDAELQQKQTNPSHHKKFGEIMMEGHSLITFNEKIWVPAEMLLHLISWYHENLQHKVLLDFSTQLGCILDIQESGKISRNLYNPVIHVNATKLWGRNTMVRYLSPSPTGQSTMGSCTYWLYWPLGYSIWKWSYRKTTKLETQPSHNFSCMPWMGQITRDEKQDSQTHRLPVWHQLALPISSTSTSYLWHWEQIHWLQISRTPWKLWHWTTTHNS